jgi:hypothetical protein
MVPGAGGLDAAKKGAAKEVPGSSTDVKNLKIENYECVLFFFTCPLLGVLPQEWDGFFFTQKDSKNIYPVCKRKRIE